ncbi:uncharacterized protein ATC70_010916 [Mucor velutinosus]|uniref:DH domain-containing protein n=1 Tax=Mucor velutinosus TaxID=708070 RepID=A0AAN7DEH0_9FUNG|nr:hypothetical protein ATC70_010916 [Mucor velutinosus]
METIIDKVEQLGIDTSDIAKWSDSEDTTKEPLTPVSIDLHSDHPPPLDVSMTTSPIKQHKRSASAVYEYTIDSLQPHHQSSSDLKQYVQRNVSHNKKKWFQLPRMNLKRQQSTPPRRGFGGLKAGLVEPPEPPPQLLFNLDWSTSLKGPTALWENDVKQSASTPVTPVVSRRSSGVYSDTIFSSEYYTTRHKSSSSVSSASTVVPEQDNHPTTTQSESDMLAVRRLSCPNYKYQNIFLDEAGNTTSKSKTGGTSTKLFSIIPMHQRPNLKRGTSTESVLCHSSPSPVSTPSSSSVFTPPPSPPLSKSSADYKTLLFNVYAPDTNELVLNFRNIQPRTVKLKRRCNLKSEQKALHQWQTYLLAALKHSFSVQRQDNTISPAKKARYFLTRRFILQEFYTTEITFWNQLNFSKVMFCDPLKLALERGSVSARPTDMDWFANLQDLMNFSSILIRRLGQFQVDKIPPKEEVNDPNCQTDQVNIGLVLREMTESMVTFLRCALDYKANKKLMDQRKTNKAYTLYNEKLALRKETRQFTLGDYLIIPIQRVTRYGLLLADLEKHTEPTHPDYRNIKISLCIIQSLASAMNAVQN